MPEWKRAILAFLDGMWSQARENEAGMIALNDTALYLTRRGYSLSWPAGMQPMPRPSLDRHLIHVVTCERDKTELGLARFVRASDIRMLVIEFSCDQLMLWKGESKTDFDFSVVPRTF